MSATTAIKERPMIFGAESVRAILDGRKTMTRRVVKPQPVDVSKTDPFVWFYGEYWLERPPCPYGEVGDRLWVRETYTLETEQGIGYPVPERLSDGRPVHYAPEPEDEQHQYWTAPHYKATDPKPDLSCERENHDGGPCCHWRSPIFMPRWASRLTLEITAVRVERVQDISEADAKAEADGFWWRGSDGRRETPSGGAEMSGKNVPEHKRDYRRGFREAWDHFNAKRGYPWADNPWVWVLEFRRVAGGGA